MFYHSFLFSSFPPFSFPFFKSSFKFFPVFHFGQNFSPPRGGGEWPEYMSLFSCKPQQIICPSVRPFVSSLRTYIISEHLFGNDWSSYHQNMARLSIGHLRRFTTFNMSLRNYRKEKNLNFFVGLEV